MHRLHRAIPALILPTALFSNTKCRFRPSFVLFKNWLRPTSEYIRRERYRPETTNSIRAVRFFRRSYGFNSCCTKELPKVLINKEGRKELKEKLGVSHMLQVTCYPAAELRQAKGKVLKQYLGFSARFQEGTKAIPPMTIGGGDWWRSTSALLIGLCYLAWPSPLTEIRGSF